MAPILRVPLLILAVLLFLIATAGVPTGRVSLLALGLACLAGAELAG